MYVCASANMYGLLIISEYACLLEWLSNHCCLLKHILCFLSTCTEPTNSLYWNYAERNNYSFWSRTHNFVWWTVLIKMSVCSNPQSQWVVTSHSLKAWSNLWYSLQAFLNGVMCWDCLPDTNIIKTSLPWQTDHGMVRFEQGSYGWNTNVLTTWPCANI